MGNSLFPESSDGRRPRWGWIIALLVFGLLLYIPAAAKRREAAALSVTAYEVTLKFEIGVQVIRGMLRYDGSKAAPDSLWVWAYYVNPKNPGGSWADAPIILRHPFAGGNPAPFEAQGGFHWATNASAPVFGYQAYVSASAVSPEAAQVPTDLRVYQGGNAVGVTSIPSTRPR